MRAYARQQGARPAIGNAPENRPDHASGGHHLGYGIVNYAAQSVKGRKTLKSKIYLSAALLGMALTSQGVAQDDLLPPDLNPVQAGLETSEIVALTLKIFDSTRSSKRHYDHVAPLDGFTFGLGHYPQSGSEKFFGSLRDDKDGKAYDAFLFRSHQLFRSREDAWGALARITGLGNDVQPTKDRIESALNRTIFGAEFMKRYRKHCKRKCKPGEPDLYHEHQEWLVPLLKYVLRDRTLVEWQIDYWHAFLIQPASLQAKRAGIDSVAGIIGVASARSSAGSWGKKIVEAAQTGKLSHNGVTWDWNRHPFVVNPTDDQLMDWRLLARWQWYCSRKGKIRNRSRAYFNEFLADKWVLATFDGGLSGIKDPANWDPSNVRPK
ncbi:MAG: hypothetical protein QNJ94_18140 [Alphaproteobacteria bacterium]|nr:hypothetical protein [Alphaproteobacteria bacterium]